MAELLSATPAVAFSSEYAIDSPQTEPRSLKRLRRLVPSVTQYASPSLIAAISYQGHPRTEDPRWPETGAPDLEAYAEWSVRWCGMACLRMVLLARDGVAPTLYDLAKSAMAYGAYSDDAERPDGLIYHPFVEYARREYGLDAEVIGELNAARLLDELGQESLVIASVHPEIRRPHVDPPTRGGHLVLVTGQHDGLIQFHDPAGHTPDALVATLPIPVFDRFAARRGVTFRNVALSEPSSAAPQTSASRDAASPKVPR